MKLKNNVLNQAIKFALATTTVGLFFSGSAIAADEQQQTKINKNVENIVLVGTRSAPRSIDVIGGKELLKGTVPSFNVHKNRISDAASLVRQANLYGLPSDSTLVL